MDAFVTKRKRKQTVEGQPDEDSTDIKLALLSSLHPSLDPEMLLNVLVVHDGAVEAASGALVASAATTHVKKVATVVGTQTSLRAFTQSRPSSSSDGSPSQTPKRPRLLSRKGATLHLYDPVDVSDHTPCTIIHNFLPPDDADRLLVEMLEESKTFGKMTFKLFENTVQSPHTSSFFVGSAVEQTAQKCDYVYNGARLTVRRGAGAAPCSQTLLAYSD